MRSSIAVRIHLMITFVLVTCGAVAGACFGLLLGGRLTAAVAGAAAGLGAGIGSFLSRRHVAAFLRPDQDGARSGGYAEGIADAVLVSIATYQAAVFPLTPDGVSGQEREARRTVAYRVSAYDGLPLAVRVSAAAALEAVDQGQDAERARAAMKALSLTVYDHRAGR
ncbi:hypothetical protein AMK16_20230 [Streptomyces sp. CB00455]|uniref:hypothetical protein n=1 Tax=Streptomyces sp. CB00455 TaxID=1703927 RepID=UPI0009394220|nr:hypothetical protein [Streptomyces sp. CB00455]OKK17224.1 hypothetical protein AMK16_20230 [Streptomyces sp. CB00455]